MAHKELPVFIEREQAFRETPALADHVLGWQAASLRAEDHVYREGDRVWLNSDDEAATVLSAEQAAALNAETEAGFERQRDPWQGLRPDMKAGEDIIAEPDCQTMRGIGGAMKRHLTSLAAETGLERMVVLPMTRDSILSQQNSHPPAARAAETLGASGFADARAASGPVHVMAPLFGPLFWITRCNASAPMIVFAFEGHDLVGTLCKYGNIHFTPYGDRRRSLRILARSGFHIPADGQCQERFSGRGRIAGRRITV